MECQEFYITNEPHTNYTTRISIEVVMKGVKISAFTGAITLTLALRRVLYKYHNHIRGAKVLSHHGWHS